MEVKKVENDREMQFMIAKWVRDGKFVVQLASAVWIYESSAEAIDQFMLLGANTGDLLSGKFDVIEISNKVTKINALGIRHLDEDNDPTHEGVAVILVGLTWDEFHEKCPHAAEGQTIQ